MELKTKYNIGDKVWTVNNNKAVCFEINGINIIHRAVDEGYKTSASMTLIQYKGILIDWTLEENLYVTKEELLNSL